MSKRFILEIWWLVAAVVLIVFGPSTRDLTSPAGLIRMLHASPDLAAADVAALVAWLMLGWLALGWLALLGGRHRGRAGRCSQRAAAVLLPRVVRALLEGGVGLTVTFSATSAVVAAAPGSAIAAPGPVENSPAALPSLDRQPTTQVQLAPLPAVPAPELAPSATAGAPDPMVGGQLPAGTAEVVVRRGDCLWSLVARALGPDAPPSEVARAWPRWYAANREVIGSDPGLLLPGQRLIAPSSPS